MRDVRGFTLVEMLIVVVIVGMLAGVAIPKMMGNSDEAKAVVLEQNMAVIMKAAELYYHQHAETWPGAKASATGNPVSSATQASRAFERQLMAYTTERGIYSVVKGDSHPLGPYLQKIPANPFNGLSSVIVDYTTTDLTAELTSGTSGWKFYALTGKLVPNHVNNVPPAGDIGETGDIDGGG